MAKTSTATSILLTADAKNKAMVERCTKMVDTLYKQAIADLSQVATMVKQEPDGSFSFDSNPAALKKADKIIRGLSDRITAIIGEGDRRAWNAACDKSDQFIDAILNTSKMPKAKVAAYKDRNLEGLAAFQERKVNGLNLSDRVWTHVQKLKSEVQLVASTMPKKDAINTDASLMKIENGIGTGMSAAELSREVRSCLKEPNKLFRRVRNKNGQLVLSRPAKLYHPGQGVYRSSYKNAMRLTRTEINMAYRQSDHMRWGQLDFVVGMKISLSNTHDEPDFCDELHGDYPKEFKFIGWHPQCKCFATPILKPLDEVDADVNAKGEYKNLPSSKQVTKCPAGFDAYMRDNIQRISGWKNTPYYIKDNPQYVDRAINPGKYITKALVLDQDTTKQLLDFELYGTNHAGSKKFTDALAKAKEAQLKGDQAAFDEAMATMDFTKKTNERIAALNARKKAGKNQVSEEELRKQRIQEAAEKRHAARTPEKEKEIREYAKQLKVRTDDMRNSLQDAINSTWKFKDIDAAEAVDILSGAKGAITTAGGKTVQASLQKMMQQVKTIKEQEKELIKKAQKLTDIFPDAVANLEDYSIKDLEALRKGIKSQLSVINKKTLTVQESMLEGLLQVPNDKIVEDFYKRQLAEVKISIKVEALTPQINALATKAASSSIQAFKTQSLDAMAALSARDVTKAEALVQKMKDLEVAVDRYDAMKAMNYTTSGKYNNLMSQAEAFLNSGQIMNASQCMDAAAAIKAQNDLNVARRNARNARAAEAKSQTTEPKKKKMTIDKAESYDDLKEALGSDMPVMLEHYEDSVKRTQYTSPEFRANAKEIERKMKEFFDSSDFAHQCHSELLADIIEYRGNTESGGYLVSGVLNNLQANEAQAKVRKKPGYSIKGVGYDEGRRSYGHFAFGYQDDKSRVPVSKRLKDEDYYRCGTPIPKGLDEAWEASKKARGYGDAQIVFRKDRVITTWTWDNSLGQDTIPSLTCDPKVCSIDGKPFKNYKSKKYTHSNILESGKGYYDDASYIELQYLPKASTGLITPRDMERIILPSHPEQIHPKAIWDKWKKEGVDIYYYDVVKRKVVLYQKGDPLESPEEKRKRIQEAAKKRHAERDAKLKKKGQTADERIQELIDEREKRKIAAEDYSRKLLANKSSLVNADITNSDFKVVLEKINKGNYLGAEKAAKEIEARIAEQKKQLDAMKDYIEEPEKWHDKFTIKELQDVREEIIKKVNFMNNKYQYKDDPDQVIAKWAKEADYQEHPEKIDTTWTKKKYWEITKSAYQAQRDKAIYKYRKDSIDQNIQRLEDFKTKDKKFKTALAEIQAKAKAGKWGDVEELIETAKTRMLSLSGAPETKVLKLGECGTVVFEKSAFEQIRKDAAKWFRCPPDKKPTAAQIRKAFKEADEYMSQYAEDMWKKLTPEEKMVMWLYSDGSQYINQEMLGTYCLHMMDPKNVLHNGLIDANILTSIIENKAMPLKDDIWMQSGKSTKAFEAMFGKRLSRSQRSLDALVGKEGSSELFMSCHSARDGAFTKDTNTGEDNDVVLTIFMPKGTKGAYMEPFASYGDSKRGSKGLSWDGSRQKEAPSDQVEFLLQRGSKFRITKAEIGDDGKYHIVVELIEQTGKEALNTNIIGLDRRTIRRPKS